MITVQNPIVGGFHPDPSVLRVGGDYYLATSTFEWFPGVEIRHSRDLVNWTLVARPLNREGLLDMSGVLSGGGVWAPCLSYDNGLFYLVYSITRTFDETTQDTQNFLITAPNVQGPWSGRVMLNTGGFDPSLFHDKDGTKWLLNMRWDSRPGKNHFPGILMQEYSPEHKRLVGSPKLIFTGTELSFTEGPHLYSHNGYYYLMTAEGGTAQDHAVTMCRSLHRNGPFEVDPHNPMLTSRFEPDWPIAYAGHGSLTQGKDGAWYLFHLGSRKNSYGGFSVLGRETFLQNVQWDEEGWLRLSCGGRLPCLAASVPAEKETAQKSDFYRQYVFDEGGLDLHFSSLRVPLDKTMFSLSQRKGYLRLFGRESILSHHRQSFVGTQVCDTPFEAVTQMEFEPGIYQQMAGLCLFYNTANFYYMQVTWHETTGKCVQLMARDSKKTTLLSEAIPLPPGPVMLRVRMSSKAIRFFVKASGDAAIKMLPPEEDAPLSPHILSDEYANRCGEQGFTGCFIGLCCQDLTGMGLPADFAYLHIERLEE